VRQYVRSARLANPIIVRARIVVTLSVHPPVMGVDTFELSPKLVFLSDLFRFIKIRHQAILRKIRDADDEGVDASK